MLCTGYARLVFFMPCVMYGGCKLCMGAGGWQPEIKRLGQAARGDFRRESSCITPRITFVHNIVHNVMRNDLQPRINELWVQEQ